MHEMRTIEGGCHCGAVRFRLRTPQAVELEDCNCSICAKSGFLHLIVPAARFELLQGAESLSAYRFNTCVAEHLFCRTCGVKAFYRPRSNPDGIDVNYRCLDPGHDLIARIVPFDGRNWEANAAALAHKSKE